MCVRLPARPAALIFFVGVRMLCTAGDGTVTERQGHLDLKIFLFPSASGSAGKISRLLSQHTRVH